MSRTEHDSMGNMNVPDNALYGAQTARALQNFQVSNLRFSRPFIAALGNIKAAAARANNELGLLDSKRANAIISAAQEVVAGKWDEQFVLDIFQTGSGTSTNMNANEIIANRASELLGYSLGSGFVHPNDHVNRGQSSNDVIPTALHVSTTSVLIKKLLPALQHLHNSLDAKAQETVDVLKIGRTHLMDATPISLGQEISGWTRQIGMAKERLESCLPHLFELAIGGTAVGTGINTHPQFAAKVAKQLAHKYGENANFCETQNHFSAQAAQDAIVSLSSQLRNLAVALVAIANNVRLLSSGPRCGLAEINLPAVQPGSSIMPGKVNPVIAESVTQVAAQVIGNDACVTFAGSSGLLDLNVMLPIMAHNVLQSEIILANACTMFADSCIDGLQANEQKAAEYIEWSMSMVTALANEIGYEPAAALAKQAMQEQKTVRQICLEQQILPESRLQQLLDARRMLKPLED
ncbi:MAG: class II fumarate hydratase [Mariprofundales bacterium]